MKLSDVTEFPMLLIRGSERITVHALTSDGYALATGRNGEMLVYESSTENWSRANEDPQYHVYWMQSSFRDIKVRPILTFVFTTEAEAEYYAQQHDYTIIDYRGQEIKSGM